MCSQQPFTIAAIRQIMQADVKQHVETDNDLPVMAACAPRAMRCPSAHLGTTPPHGQPRVELWQGPSVKARQRQAAHKLAGVDPLAKWTTLPSHKTQHFHCTHASNRIR